MTEPEESDSDADAVEMGLRRQDFFTLAAHIRQYRNARGAQRYTLRILTTTQTGDGILRPPQSVERRLCQQEWWLNSLEAIHFERAAAVWAKPHPQQWRSSSTYETTIPSHNGSQ